jgi:hypothetical protein
MRRVPWRRAAAVLPFVALAARAAERIPVPITPAAPEPVAESALTVPQWMRPFGVDSWADVVRFGQWESSLAATFDDEEEKLRSPDATTQRFANRLAQENLTIRNDSITVLHPRLFTASASVGLLLQQERQEAPDHGTKENGHLVNYAFDGLILPESAYNANVSALRNESVYVQPSGSTTNARFQSESIAFHVREDNVLRERELLPYFTANFRIEQQHEEQDTSSSGQTYRQDDVRDSVTLDFQNGGETSDLSFQYQYNKLDNRVYALGSYDSNALTLNYSRDFGPTLNRRWDSRIYYYQRAGEAGGSSMKNLDLSEFLSLDHNVDRSSTYGYQLNRQDTDAGVVSTQTGTAQVNQRVYANLSVDGNVLAQYVSLPGGTIRTGGAYAGLNYQRALPWTGHFTFSASGGSALTTTQVPSGLAQITDAPYAVPQDVGAGSAILLKDRNIVAASIVVVVIKGGARVTAMLDVDYTIRVDGDRTSIVPSPSSALMQPGDPLNVSYTYEVGQDSKYRTVSNAVSASTDWSWIGGSVSHDQSDQHPLEGTDASLLSDQKRDKADVWLRGTWEQWQARVAAAATRYDSTRLAYREKRLDQYVTWLFRPGFQLNLSGNEYRTEYEMPEHVTTGGSVRLDLQWAQAGWLTTAYLSRRVYRDTLQPHEVVDEAGLRMRRSWSKLDILLAAGAQDRTRGDARALHAIFHFGAIRRF